MRLRSLFVLLVLAIAFAAAPAFADTGYSVSLNQAQEVPPSGSPGTGSGYLIVNTAQTTVTYSISYSGLTANRTVQHIHGPAAPGVNAGVLVGLLATGTTSGTLSGVTAINATIAGHMAAGNAYVNIHTGNFPGGEIRGQIFADAVKANSTTWGRIKKLYR